MKIMNSIGRKTFLFSLLTMFVGGTFLLAAEGGLLSKQDLKSLVTNAKTAEDHERLAKHFDAKADELEAESTDHKDLAAQYQSHPTIHEMKHQMSGQTAGHCQYFAADLHKASLAARQMATDHRAMAKESK